MREALKNREGKKNCWHFFSSLIATFATPYSITQSSRNYIYIYSYIYVFSSFPRPFYSQVINSVLNNWRGNNKTREFLFFSPSSFSGGIFFPFFFLSPYSLNPRARWSDFLFYIFIIDRRMAVIPKGEKNRFWLTTVVVHFLNITKRPLVCVYCSLMFFNGALWNRKIYIIAFSRSLARGFFFSLCGFSGQI